MKKLILLLLISTSVTSCKKGVTEEITAPAPAPTTPTVGIHFWNENRIKDGDTVWVDSHTTVFGNSYKEMRPFSFKVVDTTLENDAYTWQASSDTMFSDTIKTGPYQMNYFCGTTYTIKGMPVNMYGGFDMYIWKEYKFTDKPIYWRIKNHRLNLVSPTGYFFLMWR